MDLARSIQCVTEEAILRMARYAHQLTGEKYLCLAGGVALNCVANGRLLREGPFEDIWIQPAAGDAGGAVGAAFDAYHTYFERPRNQPAKGCDIRRDLTWALILVRMKSAPFSTRMAILSRNSALQSGPMSS